MNENVVAAQKALDDVKSFDLSKIARRDDLGQAFHFGDAQETAGRIQNFFSRIPAENVPELSNSLINEIANQAVTFLSLLNQIQSFDPKTEGNPNATRENIINSLSGLYEIIFNGLHPAVSFLAARQRDFSALEREADAAATTARQRAYDLSVALTESKEQAENILNDIRRVAAEQGVSQQAAFFKEEADEHDRLTNQWEKYTVRTAIGLGSFAVLTMVLALLYSPTDPYEAFQLGLSKVLIFAVIAYMLFHCARTAMAHRHNAVVNRHRENALLTFNALVTAAGTEDKRDIVLTHAAACVFSPQETGYTKGSPAPQLSSSQLIEALPRIAGS